MFEASALPHYLFQFNGNLNPDEPVNMSFDDDHAARRHAVRIARKLDIQATVIVSAADDGRLLCEVPGAGV
jgi:hypothetical protein